MEKYLKIWKSKPIKELLNFSFINLDKPSGPTSFQVSSYVKELSKLNKTAHFGTLDPKVSGVLPIAMGRACRLNDYLMHKNKTYVGIMKLHESLDEAKLKEVIKDFIGKINQMPPVKSKVRRAIREREIVSFDIIEIDDKDVLFKTEVQAGTYIRKLIHDIGEKIGGAHMLELRRIRAGFFDEEDSDFLNLYDLEKYFQEYRSGDEKNLRKFLIPAEEVILKVMPSVQVKNESVKKLLTGKPLMKNDLVGKFESSDFFAVFCEDKLVQICKGVEEGDIVGRALFVLN